MFQHWIFLFRSPAGLLLSPSICLPLSFPPTPSQMETGRATLFGDRAPWSRVWSLEETPLKIKSPEPVEWTFLCLGFNVVPEKDRTLDTISLIIFLFPGRMVQPPNSLRAPKSQAPATSSPRPHLTLSLAVNNVSNFDNSVGYLLIIYYTPSSLQGLGQNASQVCIVLLALLSQKRALRPCFIFSY